MHINTEHQCSALIKGLEQQEKRASMAWSTYELACLISESACMTQCCSSEVSLPYECSGLYCTILKQLNSKGLLDLEGCVCILFLANYIIYSSSCAKNSCFPWLWFDNLSNSLIVQLQYKMLPCTATAATASWYFFSRGLQGTTDDLPSRSATSYTHPCHQICFYSQFAMTNWKSHELSLPSPNVASVPLLLRDPTGLTDTLYSVVANHATLCFLLI